ncbi:hypothetical protein ACOMHN_040859 [Nucella lapillus]
MVEVRKTERLEEWKTAVSAPVTNENGPPTASVVSTISGSEWKRSDKSGAVVKVQNGRGQTRAVLLSRCRMEDVRQGWCCCQGAEWKRSDKGGAVVKVQNGRGQTRAVKVQNGRGQTMAVKVQNGRQPRVVLSRCRMEEVRQGWCCCQGAEWKRSDKGCQGAEWKRSDKGGDVKVQNGMEVVRQGWCCQGRETVERGLVTTGGSSP